MKALVVDDNHLIRSNVAEALRDDGWEVSEADSAEQAFELLQRDCWSLVFWITLRNRARPGTCARGLRVVPLAMTKCELAQTNELRIRVKH